jgi:putative transposase
MKQKRRSMEEIIRIIRQADGGQTVREVCREHNVHQVTFHRWKRKYGGLKLDDAQKLKGREREDSELRKMLAETLLENRALKIVNAKNSKPGAQAASGNASGPSGALLGATGLWLHRLAYENVSVPADPAPGSPRPSYRTTDGLKLEAPQVRVSSHPGQASSGGLDGEQEAGSATARLVGL